MYLTSNKPFESLGYYPIEINLIATAVVDVDVVVQIYPWFGFYFLFFLGMVNVWQQVWNNGK